MGQSPSYQANSRWASQEIPCLLRNYPLHNNPPLIPIQCQMKLVHTSQLTSLSSILILPSQLLLVPRSDLFPSGFPSKILYASHLSHMCYMICSSHPPWFYHCNRSWRTVQVMKILVTRFSSRSYHSIFTSKYSPQHPVFKHPQFMFFL